MSVEEYVKKLEESGDYTIYYDIYDAPDYAINETTNKMIIFQYGYSLTAEAKSIDDYVKVNTDDNITKKFIFEEIDSRLDNAIDEYNKCLAHYTRTSSNLNSEKLSKATGALEALEELREELINEYYW
jgi:site-specific DNA-cytosine methylase